MTQTAPSSPRRLELMLPREHGAYGQLLFPLVTALVLARGAPSALALSLACIALFVAHEPLLVLLGHRGPRARRERRRAAAGWLVGCTAIGTLAGLVGVMRMAGGRPFVLVPVALAGLLLPMIARQEEHSTIGEILAAAALSSCAVPIAMAGGVAASRAFTCWIVFALAFVVATVAVRSVIARIKNRPKSRLRTSGAGVETGASYGGHAGEIRGLETIAPWTAGGVIAAALASAALGLTEWAVPAALLPICALALLLSLFPPHPRHLRTVGWSLVTATAATAIVLAITV